MTLDYIMRTESVQYLSDEHVSRTLQTFNYRVFPLIERFMLNKLAKDKLIVSAMPYFTKLTEVGKLKSLPDELVVKVLMRLDSIDIKRLMSCTIKVSK